MPDYVINFGSNLNGAAASVVWEGSSREAAPYPDAAVYL
jgi:hypothetical protein